MQNQLEIRKDEKEPIVEPTREEKYNTLKSLYAGYKKQNPVKYEQKKEVFKAKLAALKPEEKKVKEEAKKSKSK